MNRIDKRKLINIIKVVFLALAVIVLYIMPGVVPRRINTIMIICFVYIALAQSWAILTGMTGLVSVTHAVYFGIGVYIPVIVVGYFEKSFILGIVISLLFNMVIALIVGYIGSKLSGFYFTMALIGIQLTFYTLAMTMVKYTGGTVVGRKLPSQYSLPRPTLCRIALIIAICTMIIYVLIRKSRFGTSLIALRDNPNLALSLGSNIYFWRIMATEVSALMASAVGTFYLVYLMAAHVEVFAGSISVKIMMVSLVGGTGSVWGPVLGSSMIIIDEYIRGATPANFAPYAVIFYAMVLIFMLTILPDGIISLFTRKQKVTEISTK